MKYVRLTMSPHKTSEVTDNAYTDHKRWGQVLEEFDKAPDTTDTSASDNLGAEVPSTTAAYTTKKKTSGS